MRMALGLFFTLIFLAISGTMIYRAIEFNINLGGYLKRAADANTVSLAEENLELAIAEIERRNMVAGTTKVFWESPARDVEFWYTNLIASRDELMSLPEDSSQLEKTNVLMKLRETLLDSGSQGDSITHPPGISLFPNNQAYWFGWWASLVLAVIFFIFSAIELEPRRRYS